MDEEIKSLSCSLNVQDRNDTEPGAEITILPNMVVCHPPLSMPRRSSPIPEKLPKEKVLRVGETSK